MSNLFKQVLALAVVAAAATIGNRAQGQVTIDQVKAADAPGNLCNGGAR